MPGQRCHIMALSWTLRNAYEALKQLQELQHVACAVLTSLLDMRRLAQQGKAAFGPYGGCQGQRFPFRQCQLKNQTDPTAGPLRIYEAGDLQPYVSGYFASGSTA